jgi:hypothetical protein
MVVQQVDELIGPGDELLVLPLGVLNDVDVLADEDFALLSD